METLTLEFENARTAQAVYGGDPKLLHELERRLDVRTTARDGWIRVEGEKMAVERARDAFEQLHAAVKKGLTIHRQEFEHALEASTGNGSSESLASLIDTRILCSPRKPPVVPRTAGQKTYVQAIQSHDITFGSQASRNRQDLPRCSLCCGRPQTGKGQAAHPHASRCGGRRGLGLPARRLAGEILPYLRPLYDALHDLLEPDELQKLMDKNIIEIAPLAYMRGRTLSGSFVILDEAQNTTAKQMLMFLTRLELGSRCVVTGDVTQD
jgi:phosphate starvation-inducible PhoH-like protein